MPRYTVLLHRDQDVPGYSVVVPELPGCFSHGRTLDEALAHAREAIECHLEAMAEDGEEMPVEREPFIMMWVEAEPSMGEKKNRTPVSQVQFVMHRVRYSLTEKQVSELAGRVSDIPAPDGKRLWYVQVQGKELPVRWFMQSLLGVGADSVELVKGIEVFRKLGFEVIYKGKKLPSWLKLKSA